jgi:3-oxoacyl-[acyl-carrier protein] reductase
VARPARCDGWKVYRPAPGRGFIAVGHYGQAREVAGMVAYLAGPGGRHVTGSSILVDGGFAA